MVGRQGCLLLATVVFRSTLVYRSWSLGLRLTGLTLEDF